MSLTVPNIAIPIVAPVILATLTNELDVPALLECNELIAKCIIGAAAHPIPTPVRANPIHVI